MANQSWSIEHFSQANPVGDGQSNVPALLRLVAESIEALGPVEVQDLVMHTETTADGDWPSPDGLLPSRAGPRDGGLIAGETGRYAATPISGNSGCRPSSARLADALTATCCSERDATNHSARRR